MTTLPQTTPIRMPRPGGTPTPVVAVPGPGAVPHVAQANQGLTLADAWRVIRGHTWLIVAFVCVSAVAGFFINDYLAKYHSRFTALGFIQYQPVNNYDPIHNPNPSIDSNSLQLELQTQAQMLRHDSLLTRAMIESQPIRNTAWFRQFPTPQAAKIAMAEDLSVTPIPGTRLIQVSMVTPIAKDSRTIVEELGQLHIKSQKELAKNKELDRTKLLVQRRKDLEARQRENQKLIDSKSALLNQGGFDSVAGVNTTRNEEVILAAEQTRLATEINAQVTRLETFLAKIKIGEDPVEISAAVEADPHVAAFRNAIERIDLDMQLITLGSEHPRVKKMMAERDAYAAKLEKMRGDKLAGMRVGTIEGLNTNIASLKRRYEAIDRQLEAVKEQNKGLATVYRDYVTAKDDAAMIKAELKEVTDSLDAITQATNSDISGVNWSTRPTTPDRPSFPKLPTTMTMAILTGLGLALGIAFLRELTDTTVRSPRDIVRLGQLNLLGMVSDINDDAQSAGAKLPLVIFEAPHAIIAEQFRQVRTRMQHAASLDSTRSILITSPGAGDGKSTVACNLAAGLALNGRRILLVDANFRRPELHKVFNLTNEAGFSDVLNQLETLPQNIRETQVPNLAVLTSGPKPVNATELFESQLLVDFIEKALEEFDHVVFDSGPLLVVSETVALAPRVDGVVTVVRARHNSRGLLVRMRDTLRQLKAEHLGVILNGVRAQGGGYYGRNIKAYYAYSEDGQPQLTGPTSAE